MSSSPRAWCRLVALTALALVAAPVRAEEQPTIGIDEIAVGARGYGLSVFSGSTPERFEVEVLGVLRNLRPDASFVVARLSGKNLESTGVIAGMSGSPVYIDGRLAGAVAFSWPFAKEAIAGITPIDDMRAIDSASPPPGTMAAPGALARIEWSDLVNPNWRARRDLLKEALASLAAPRTGESTSGLLWSVSGFGAGARARLASALPTLAPLSGTATGELAGSAALSERVGGSAASGAVAEAAGRGLVPGASVAAVLVDGDLRLAATGTVTDRDGDRLLAFGHSILGQGPFNLPMATSEVVTVFPSAYNSFKLATVGKVVGGFRRDHPAGVSGVVGPASPMIPLQLSISGPARRDYSLRVAELPALLPSLVGISCLGAWDATTGFAAVKSADLEIRLEFDGRAPLLLVQSFDGAGAGGGALSYLMAVLSFVVENDFGMISLRGIDIAVRLDVTAREAKITFVRADRTVAAAGDEVELQIDLRSADGSESRRAERLTLPQELPNGRYTLLVGDGASVSAARLAAVPVPPTTIDQVFELVASLRPANELGILGLLPAAGLAAAGELRPQLPASMRWMWAKAGVRATTGVKSAVLQQVFLPSERPLSGLVRIDLEIRNSSGGKK